MKRRIILLAAVLLFEGLALSYPAFADTSVRGMGAKPTPSFKPAAAPRAGVMALPASVDLRAWAVPVGNQGAVGSCVAWTYAHALMGWEANRRGSTTNLFAPMYMYSQINGGVDSGSSPADAMNLLIGQGNDTRAHYTQGDFNWWHLPTADEQANAAKYRYFSRYEVLFSGATAGANGALAIRTALAAQQPVAITFPVRPGFDNLSSTSTLDTDSTGPIRGWHEVLAVGYDAQGLLIQNSWGTGWGSSGYGRLAWSVVEADIVEANVMIPGTPASFPLVPTLTLLLL